MPGSAKAVRPALFTFIGILIAAMALTLIFARPIVLNLAKFQLDSQLRANHVAIEGFSIKAGELVFNGITVQKAEMYEMKAGEVYISYTLASLLRGKLSQVRIRDAAVMINTPKNKLSDMRKTIRIRKSPISFSIDSFEISNLRVFINTSDLGLDARISLGLGGPKTAIRHLTIDIAAFDGFDIHIKDVHLEASQETQKGVLSGKKIAYNKIDVTEINGTGALSDSTLTIDPLSAVLFNGHVTGKATVKFDKTLAYELALTAKDLNVARLVDYLNLTEKIQMSGIVGGEIRAKGMNTEIGVLNGSFAVVEPGGTLIIKDEVLLESIAAKTKQPIEFIRQSFQDYRYSTGTVKVSLGTDGLAFDIDMEGEKGKRAIKVIVHKTTGDI
jgi:hypothetical protein